MLEIDCSSTAHNPLTITRDGNHCKHAIFQAKNKTRLIRLETWDASLKIYCLHIKTPLSHQETERDLRELDEKFQSTWESTWWKRPGLRSLESLHKVINFFQIFAILSLGYDDMTCDKIFDIKTSLGFMAQSLTTMHCFHDSFLHFFWSGQLLLSRKILKRS